MRIVYFMEPQWHLFAAERPDHQPSFYLYLQSYAYYNNLMDHMEQFNLPIEWRGSAFEFFLDHPSGTEPEIEEDEQQWFYLLDTAQAAHPMVWYSDGGRLRGLRCLDWLQVEARPLVWLQSDIFVSLARLIQLRALSRPRRTKSKIPSVIKSTAS